MEAYSLEDCPSTIITRNAGNNFFLKGKCWK
jgi:hypothetical protein